ncbi:DedA family protein [Flavobacterium suncheonense]|uniref:Alkaline phosphatase n=1 Tax=Flavobacterium suncheonense GH29-5 = DSM 17707 TaxID=1121899 RepID=A0A0A2MCH6_9FLAO|nr:VTT domain-containing protein [Flavobacterium suncheonense]KGO90382.1 alkaline phosphatase [Flavobacterium suncheonense GH29-5 = DSM 17707]
MKEEFHWTQLLNPEFYINLEIAGHHIGIYVVLFIVFAETGLFAGFFLPGDSLLFLSGIYSETLMRELVYIENEFTNVAVLASLVAISGVIGNIFGYWFGAKSGHFLYSKEDNFWFKKKYLIQSRLFFEKHGGRAIIFARFLPIIRTFAPIVAGIVQMEKKKFMFYNIVSSFLWSFVLIFSGHYLYRYLLDNHQIDLKKYIELIVVGIIVISTAPIVINTLKNKLKARK